MENNLSDTYPVAKFLNSLMEQFGHCRSEFVRSLGYRNVDRGLKRLDAWMDEGKGYSKIIKQIEAAFPNVVEELQESLTETKKVKAAEAEVAFFARCKAEVNKFIPHIVADGERTVPSSICFYGITGAKSDLIELPDHVLVLPLEEQLSALPDLMRSYKIQHNGQVHWCPN